MSVFVGVESKEGGTTVFPAREYQASAFATFMSNPHVVEIHFHYPGNIIFKVQKMNTQNLKGDYSRFCVLVNERGEKHILSDNEAQLRSFVGWKNRLTMGGSKKRKSMKRKSSKRKSSKRK